MLARTDPVVGVVVVVEVGGPASVAWHPRRTTPTLPASPKACSICSTLWERPPEVVMSLTRPGALHLRLHLTVSGV